MKKRQGRYTAAFAILLVLVLVFLVLNVCIGSVNIPVTEIPKILFGNGADDVYTDIVMGIRFPRALAAAILGGGLALSGYLLQTFFHNPIAGPFGYFLWCKADGVFSHGGISWKCSEIKLLAHDYCRICGSYDLYGICHPYVEGDGSDVHAHCQRCYDWLYLLGYYGFYCYLCG